MKRIALLLALALCACTHTDNTPQKKYSFIDTYGYGEKWRASEGINSVKVHTITIREYAEQSRFVRSRTIDHPEKSRRYTFTADPQTEYCTVGMEHRVGLMDRSSCVYVDHPFILAEGVETILELAGGYFIKEEPKL